MLAAAEQVLLTTLAVQTKLELWPDHLLDLRCAVTFLELPRVTYSDCSLSLTRLILFFSVFFASAQRPADRHFDLVDELERCLEAALDLTLDVADRSATPESWSSDE